MARGGYRPGAGRKTKGNHLNPRAIADIKNKIKTNAIIKRLTDHIEGNAEMSASAVTAALGLLRKVMPDLAAVEASGTLENIHYAVSEQPITEDEWAEQHATTH